MGVDDVTAHNEMQGHLIERRWHTAHLQPDIKAFLHAKARLDRIQVLDTPNL